MNIEKSEELTDYLRATGRIGGDETPASEVLHGGVSNRTVLVRRPSGEEWVLKQALEKLRVDVEWHSSPDRILREAQAIQWLEQLAPPGSVPRLIFQDADHHVIAMDAVPQPHENWKEVLLSGRVEPDHFWQAGRLLGTVHRNAARRTEEVSPAFGDLSFFHSLRLEPYYQFTAGRVPEARAFLDSLVEETLSNRYTLVHGDFSPKNLLVYQGRLILLDHEVVHFGDGAFDIGFCMAHFLSKAHHLRPQRQVLAEAARLFWLTYTKEAECADAQMEARAARHTLGCLLARVAGRSRLEYLSSKKRARQKNAVVKLMQAPPQTIAEVINAFVRSL